MVPYGNSSIILELRQVDRTRFIGDFTHKLSIAAIRGCDWMYRFLALSPTIDNDLQPL